MFSTRLRTFGLTVAVTASLGADAGAGAPGAGAVDHHRLGDRRFLVAQPVCQLDRADVRDLVPGLWLPRHL